MQRMIQQGCHSLYRGKSKSATQFTVAGRILQLDEFLENDLVPFPGDTDTRVADADAHHITVSPATDENPAMLGVLDGIAEKILHDDPDQGRVSV